jgi:KTSC domain
MAPSLHTVDSTCVARMGYDAQTEVAYVEYHGSRHDEFGRAESKGTFVNEVIKPRYPMRRL